MTAYFVASISSHDQSWLATYGAMVPAIVRRHGGELVCRSEEFKCYEGGNDSPDYVVILTFPSMQAIDAFMNDPEYEPYKKARLDCATSDVFAIR